MSDLLEAIKNIDNCIIKPSKDSSAGIGVRSLRVTDDIVSDYDGSLEKLIKSYKGNFVIEEKVVCCDNLRNLNPSSCNTLRMHTWRNRKENKIEFVSAFLRVGRKDSLIDNGHTVIPAVHCHGLKRVILIRSDLQKPASCPISVLHLSGDILILSKNTE